MKKVDFDSFDRASQFIKDVLDGKVLDGVVFLDMPEYVNKKAELAIGHKIESHSINADEIRHISKEHGIKGKKNTKFSIPLRKEDIALLPYIMAAPDSVDRGSIVADSRKSIRYYKNLSNGYVVVVERQGYYRNEEMENITMWAESTGNKKSLSTNATDARLENRPHVIRLNLQQSYLIETPDPTDAVTAVISQKDAAKIKQDFETAKEKYQKNENNLQKSENQDKKFQTKKKKGRRI
jgi:hypothetical protein